MSGLKPVSWRVLVRRLRDGGFQGPYSGGKHLYMLKGDVVLTVPNPHGSDIGIELLKRILKQAGINPNNWRAL